MYLPPEENASPPPPRLLLASPSSTDECFQSCWLESAQHLICFDHQISDSTPDCRSHGVFAARVPPPPPPPPPPPLLICLACRFSSICSTLLDDMHLLMNGRDLWPPRKRLKTSGSRERRVELQAKLVCNNSPLTYQTLPLSKKNIYNKCDDYLYNVGSYAFLDLGLKAQNNAKEKNKSPAVTRLIFPGFSFCPQGYKNPSWTIFSLVSFQLETRCQICSTWTIRSDPVWALYWWFGPHVSSWLFFLHSRPAREGFEVLVQGGVPSPQLVSAWETHVESICADGVNLNGLMMVFMLEGHQGFDGLPRRLTSEPPGIIYQAGSFNLGGMSGTSNCF